MPHQLPAITADFVGRDTQLHQLNRLLANAGGNGGTVVISAIDGTAGIGKTALALHWAHHIAGQFPGGQLYLNMRGFDPSGTPVRPVNALHAFLEALGVARERIPATLESRAALYRSVLAERQVLVVLDNARDVTQVRPLLPARPGCLVVVTSRNRLVGLVAQEGAHPLTLDALSTAGCRSRSPSWPLAPLPIHISRSRRLPPNSAIRRPGSMCLTRASHIPACAPCCPGQRKRLSHQ